MQKYEFTQSHSILRRWKPFLSKSSTIFISEEKKNGKIGLTLEFPDLSGFTTKDPTDDPGHYCWLHSKFNYPKFQHTTLLPVLHPFLIIIFPGPSTPTGLSEPKFHLSASSELTISAEDISSEGQSHVLDEEQWHKFRPSQDQFPAISKDGENSIRTWEVISRDDSLEALSNWLKDKSFEWFYLQRF